MKHEWKRCGSWEQIANVNESWKVQGSTARMSNPYSLEKEFC